MSQQSGAETKTGGWYAHYVLFVLVLVYIFNFIDRQILSILAGCAPRWPSAPQENPRP